MILDSSSIVAVLIEEPRSEAIAGRIATATDRRVGAPTLVESGMVLTRYLGPVGRSLLGSLIVDRDIEIVDFTAAHWRAAQHAFVRYGKGRHPAGLNFGDCLTYAIASLSGEPLLCVGDDFARTDLEVVDLESADIGEGESDA